MPVDDGWDVTNQEDAQVPTTLTRDAARSVIAYNESPDIPFDRSINPCRGCEHGCIYCYARPSHAWLGFSPGLDFETRLLYKPDVATLLRQELAQRSYRPAPIALGSNTDAYQPVERRLGLTRQVLSILAETRHPVSVITKSSLLERDIDVLSTLARDRLVSVCLTLTTLEAGLARRLEPRACSPKRRLEVIGKLESAGIPVGVLIAPVMPGLNDDELERLLSAASDAGASFAQYILIRLPQEVAPMFRDWLEHHYPDKASKVMALIRQSRGGRDNDPRFGVRMSGEGPLAQLIARRFSLAHTRMAFDRAPELRTDLFRSPPLNPDQLTLF